MFYEFVGHFEYPQKLTEILMYIGVNVDESARIKLITTQSVPEKMCESLKINVSIPMIKKFIFLLPISLHCIFIQTKTESFVLCPLSILKI